MVGYTEWRKHYSRLNPTLDFPFTPPTPNEPGADAFLGADKLALIVSPATGKDLSGRLMNLWSSETFSLPSSEQTRLAGRTLSSVDDTSKGIAARPFVSTSCRLRPVKFTLVLRSANCDPFHELSPLEVGGALLAMFCSEGLSKGASTESSSGSTGLCRSCRSERGRLANVGLRGTCVDTEERVRELDYSLWIPISRLLHGLNPLLGLICRGFLLPRGLNTCDTLGQLFQDHTR